MGAVVKWTSEKPKELGWYWYQERFEPEVVRIYLKDCILRMALMNGNRFILNDIISKGHWSGPIEPPED